MAKLKTISKELPTLPIPLLYLTTFTSSTLKMGKMKIL